MDELSLSSKTMVNWFADGGHARETAAAKVSREVIEALCNKPLDEPRIKQTFLCRWCLNPVTQMPKSVFEYMQLRAIVMIPDAVSDPPICRDCYDSAVASYNRQSTNIGTSNAGHANLALRHL